MTNKRKRKSLKEIERKMKSQREKLHCDNKQHE